MQSEEIFRTIKPGVLTTFQDMGRTGYQRFGVPVSGAMDPFSMQVGNILVGNPRNTVSLEVTLIGPKLEVCAPTLLTIAITGADLEPRINDRSVAMWKSITLKKGDQLSFGKHQSGVRAYIAVAGGFDAPVIFGSSSTDGNTGFGSSLEDVKKIKGFSHEAQQGIGLVPKDIPTYEKSIKVAIIEGPHTDCFTKEGREKFFRCIHQVEANSNRMGYRLKSEEIKLNKDIAIWSDAIPFGGIQVPPNGQAIILMADRQTTGGYPRIGTVLSSDMPKIAQLVPQGEIQFYPVTVEEAQARAIKMEEFLYKLELFYKGI
ncbi:biotin-dependent carboxyltransferase family protein [Virgibacillus byunsanensis]|uniref:Biotin-dependent carboxyltransferase family protein n=1 Tax=Virgibacillus byunsanensis TaxID=570945 RepID=A0ABW3LF80_9BACI